MVGKATVDGSQNSELSLKPGSRWDLKGSPGSATWLRERYQSLFPVVGELAELSVRDLLRIIESNLLFAHRQHPEKAQLQALGSSTTVAATPQCSRT